MIDVGKTWNIGGVYFICEKDSMLKPNLRYSEHHVLDSLHTVFMTYGKDNDTREVSGVLWSGLPIIQASIGSGWVVFNSDQGFEGNYFLSSLNIETLFDRSRDVPVYRITVSMREV